MGIKIMDNGLEQSLKRYYDRLYARNAGTNWVERLLNFELGEQVPLILEPGLDYPLLRSRYLSSLIPVGSERIAVLDVGAGNGWASLKLALGDFRVFAIDFSVHAVKTVSFHRDHFLPLDSRSNLSLLQGTVHKLPFADSTFDLVLCLALLQNYQNTMTILGEIHRTCKIGGIAIIETYNRNSLWYPWARRLQRIQGIAYNEFVSMSEFRRILRRQFEIETALCYYFAPPGIWRLPNHLQKVLNSIFVVLDPCFQRIPLLGRWGRMLIAKCRRVGSAES